MVRFVWSLALLLGVLADQAVDASQVVAASVPGSTCATNTRLVYVSDGLTTNVSVCPAAATLPPLISTIYVGVGGPSATTDVTSPSSTADSGLINAGFESGELAPSTKLSSRASAEVVEDGSAFDAHSGRQYLYVGCRTYPVRDELTG